MKKVLLLLLALTLFNCSNDDDSQSGDPIVGEWKLYKALYQSGDNWFDDTWDLETTFNADGTLFIDYGQNITAEGTWKKVAGNKYEIKAEDSDGEDWTEFVYRDFFCSNNIMKDVEFDDEVYYFRRKFYEESDCDIDYEDER